MCWPPNTQQCDTRNRTEDEKDEEDEEDEDEEDEDRRRGYHPN